MDVSWEEDKHGRKCVQPRAAASLLIPEVPASEKETNMPRIAVIGPAGSGKSFLINQILGFEAANHEVSASPVTLDVSGHQFTDKGRRIELVDTPGLCGVGVTKEKIERDLRTNFDSIHMVMIVLGNKRLEPTESSEIRAMLKFFNHEKNPDKFLFLVNDRRNKANNRETKEANLRTCLNLLPVDNSPAWQWSCPRHFQFPRNDSLQRRK